MTTLKNKKGVTLIELIAVIVIMGIIATVGGIATASIMENSRERAAESAVSDVLSAAKLYFQNEADKTDYANPVTCDLLVSKGYLEAATQGKVETTTTGDLTVTYNVSARTYTLKQGTGANDVVIVGGYTVTYTPADGKFTAAKTGSAATTTARP